MFLCVFVCNSGVKTAYDFTYAHAFYLNLKNISTRKRLRPLTPEEVLSANISECCASQTLQCETFFCLFVCFFMCKLGKKLSVQTCCECFCCMIKKVRIHLKILMSV